MGVNISAAIQSETGNVKNVYSADHTKRSNERFSVQQNELCQELCLTKFRVFEGIIE